MLTPDAAKALAEAGPWAVVLFIGAVGTVGMSLVIRLLWKDHKANDAKETQRADDNFLLARDAVDGVKRLADRAARARRTDKL